LGSAFFAWILPSFEARMVLLLWLCLSACYSLRPLRFKSRLFFDSFSNVLYILPGVIVFLAYAPLAEMSWHLVISAWAWAMGMHLFSALPDIEADRSAQVKTTAVWLGHKYATLLTLLYFATAAVLIATNVALWMGVVGFLAYCLPTVYVLFLTEEESQKLLKVYKVFPVINAICGGCIFVYIFFEHQLWG
jgi:4-hydroxybenzoate polyprenyltransferase